MPTYDYQCESCQNVFEKRQSFHDEPIAFCPECNSKAKRKISLVPVIFKGNGWYVTDYSKKSSTVTSNGNGKTEAKPDAAKDSKPAEAKSSGDSAAPKTESASSKSATRKEPASSRKSGES